MPHRYQVKFIDRNTGQTVYGIAREFGAEAEECSRQGLVLVNDAVKPACYAVPKQELIDIPMQIGRFDLASNRFVDCDEYHTYVADQFQSAQQASQALPEGVHAGSLFSIGVADGQAWYVVTKVNKKTCKVEWRGFCPDRWTDHHFGWGGSFPINDVERYVNRYRAADRQFGRNRA